MSKPRNDVKTEPVEPGCLAQSLANEPEAPTENLQTQRLSRHVLQRLENTPNLWSNCLELGTNKERKYDLKK